MNRLLFILTISALLSGCFLDEDDEPLPINIRPTASDSSVTTQTEQPVMGDLVASDENDVLTFSLNDEASFGEVEVSGNGMFTYTPQNEFTGSDSFTFTVTDSSGVSDEGTVTITVEALTVQFSSLARTAFTQSPTDEPLRLNGRIIVDNANESEFDDLLNSQP